MNFRRALFTSAALLATASLSFGGSMVERGNPPLDGGIVPELPDPVPRFALFGWVSPPLALTAEARYAEMAHAGFNVTLLASDDSGCVKDNLARLEASRPTGVRNLLLDNRLDSIFAARPATLAIADSIVKAYTSHPAFLGYYLGDEPNPEDFARLGEWFDILRRRDLLHPSWNSLRGRAGFASRAAFESYVRSYVAATRPAILCNSHYDFTTSGDSHLLTENVATMTAIARETGIPCWGVVLLVEHGVFRHVTDGMLRWQVAQWVAYGARGVGYFTYWTPQPDPYYDWQPAMIEYATGLRTATFDTVSAINAKLAPIGNTLAGTTWLATMHAGSVPPGGTPFRSNSAVAAVSGRATLGFFSDSTAAPMVFVANADSLAPRTVTLTFSSRRRVWRLRDDGSAWTELSLGAQRQVALALAPGDFTLLRLSGPVDGIVAGVPGAGPGAERLRLDSRPNPARGDVSFALGGVTGPARLEIVDVTGRRVWSAACPAGTRALRWNGERASGGRAPAGVYLARLTCDGGIATRRVAWLGPR